MGLTAARHQGALQVTLYGETAAVGEGQRVAVELKLRPPPRLQEPRRLRLTQPSCAAKAYCSWQRAGRVSRAAHSDEPLLARARQALGRGRHRRSPARNIRRAPGRPDPRREDRTCRAETDEAFRRAGVYHILAVSGFNVALLASSVFLRALGARRVAPHHRGGGGRGAGGLRPRRRRSGLRAPRHSHGPPCCWRPCSWTGSLSSHERARPGRARAPRLAPGDLWDPGFQLSFAATAGIIYLTPSITSWLAAAGAGRPGSRRPWR